MAFSCGFYNSIGKDRLYSATQFGEMFDGLINDGVYATIGDCFMTVPGNGLGVKVKSGRAWFNKTWSVNTTDLPLDLPLADFLLPRIDTVVLEVDTRVSVRNNSIKIISGYPGVTPVPATLFKSDGLYQYPLAYVTVAANASQIQKSDINIQVGKAPCPFVTGILQTADITDIFQQWEGQFEDWFAIVQSQLSGDVAANLLNQINQKVSKSDKATSSDINAGTPNKWIDAAGLKTSIINTVYPAGSSIISLEKPNIPGIVKADGRWIKAAEYALVKDKLGHYEGITYGVNNTVKLPSEISLSNGSEFIDLENKRYFIASSGTPTSINKKLIVVEFQKSGQSFNYLSYKTVANRYDFYYHKFFILRGILYLAFFSSRSLTIEDGKVFSIYRVSKNPGMVVDNMTVEVSPAAGYKVIGPPPYCDESGAYICYIYGGLRRLRFDGSDVAVLSPVTLTSSSTGYRYKHLYISGSQSIDIRTGEAVDIPAWLKILDAPLAVFDDLGIMIFVLNEPIEKLYIGDNIYWAARVGITVVKETNLSFSYGRWYRLYMSKTSKTASKPRDFTHLMVRRIDNDLYLAINGLDSLRLQLLIYSYASTVDNYFNAFPASYYHQHIDVNNILGNDVPTLFDTPFPVLFDSSVSGSVKDVLYNMTHVDFNPGSSMLYVQGDVISGSISECTIPKIDYGWIKLT